VDDFLDEFCDTEGSSREKTMMNKKDIRILIVDDNQSARRGLIALLNSLGHGQHFDFNIEIVGEAENGQEAVSIAQDLAPDLIFMDTQMPVMDGLEATKIIKKQGMNTRIIILSMHGNQREMAKNVGADDFIQKGTEVQAIKQVVSLFSNKSGRKN